MRCFNFLLVCCLAFLLVGCGSAPKVELIIDDFEGPLDEQTVDRGASSGSSVKVAANTNQKTSGLQSMKIEYELKDNGYMWIARGYKLDVKGAGQWIVLPEAIDWKKYNAISVMVYGSNSGGIIAFDLKDSGGELWRFLVDDDFTGWKEIVCPFSSFFARQDWQPDIATKNDVLDFPVFSIQLEPKTPGAGVLSIDCVKLIAVSENKGK